MCSNVSYSWMERNILVNNTVGNGAAPDLSGKDALGSDQPGLTDMTLKALEVLKKRGGDDGFFLMSEAASVDKQVSNVLLLLFYHVEAHLLHHIASSFGFHTCLW